MRNPKSTSAPIVTGPGGEYEKHHWPMQWANRETFAVLLISFVVLIGFTELFLYDPLLLFGLVAGGVVMHAVRGQV